MLAVPNLDDFDTKLAKMCEHQEDQLTTVARAYLDNTLKNGEEYVSRIEDEQAIVDYKAQLQALEGLSLADGI